MVGLEAHRSLPKNVHIYQHEGRSLTEGLKAMQVNGSKDQAGILLKLNKARSKDGCT